MVPLDCAPTALEGIRRVGCSRHDDVGTDCARCVDDRCARLEVLVVELADAARAQAAVTSDLRGALALAAEAHRGEAQRLRYVTERVANLARKEPAQ